MGIGGGGGIVVVVVAASGAFLQDDAVGLGGGLVAGDDQPVLDLPPFVGFFLPGAVGGDRWSFLGCVGGELRLGGGDVDVVDQVECQRLHFFKVVVVGEQAGELVLVPVEDRGDPPSNVDLTLDLQVFERLAAEPLFAKRAGAPSHGARSGTLAEDAIHAGLAHLVVAFRVHQKAHVRVQVARGFADRADF